MAEGGFVIKFDGKKAKRCYAVSFDYDEWQYTINNKTPRKLPPKLKIITIKAE